MSFSESIDKYIHSHGIKEKSESDFLAISEGDNKMRVLTEPIMFRQRYDQQSGYRICYDGCGYCGKDDPVSHKGLSWVETDEGLKLFRMPWTIIKMLKELSESDEYSFHSFPMPYYINIRAKDAGKKEVNYSILPSRENKEVPQEVMRSLKEKTECAEIIKRMQDKQRAKDERPKIDYPEEPEINTDDIPF